MKNNNTKNNFFKAGLLQNDVSSIQFEKSEASSKSIANKLERGMAIKVREHELPQTLQNHLTPKELDSNESLINSSVANINCQVCLFEILVMSISNHFYHL